MKILLLVSLVISYLFSANSVTGIIKPMYDGKIAVSTDGITVKFLKKEGDRVKKGDPILQLDNKLQKLETKRRKLALQDRNQIESLEKSLIILNEMLKQKEHLYKDAKAVSLNDLNRFKIQYITTKAELENLKENKKKEKIEYEISASVLKYYTLKSPVNGVITKIEPKIGEWVQAGKAIVNIVNIQTCFVEVDLTLKTIEKIKIGSLVEVKILNGSKSIYKEGVVEFISAKADSSSKLIRVKVYFDNKDKTITPGITAEVILKSLT